jgi:hypothetical protein
VIVHVCFEARFKRMGDGRTLECIQSCIELRIPSTCWACLMQGHIDKPLSLACTRPTLQT